MEIGDKLPEFLGIDQDGNEVKLSDFQGKKLVLYIYPRDATPGCTNEACNLRDNYQSILDKGYAVVGVSIQSAESHKKFIAKYSLPFPVSRLMPAQKWGSRCLRREENVWKDHDGYLPHDLRDRRERCDH